MKPNGRTDERTDRQRRKTCYNCGHEGHLAIDCYTEEVNKVNIFNEEDFPAIQLSGEVHSSSAGVKEGEESVTVSQVPATTRCGVERKEVPAQTITQDAVDPDGTTHPDGSKDAVQETSTTCEAEIHRERNNTDQTKGKIYYDNMEYDKAVDDMEPKNMTGTVCEVARGENMERMEEIVEVTCIMSPSRNKNDANKKDQNKPEKNELEINGSDDENQVKVKTDGGTNGDLKKFWKKKDRTKQNKNNENQSDLSGQVNSQTENGLEYGKRRKDDGKKMDLFGKDDSWWEKVEHVQSWTVRAVSGSKVMLSKRDGKEIAKKEANKGNNSTDEEGKGNVKRKKIYFLLRYYNNN
ncbi:putative Zinc knuckle-containing protein 3 [Homarus americanus]|uniref:Putative Zinc knuckle-containing protein 3 n=1 Tax=Homarus americanus TaxID=6706 RepID=A0A8J5JJY6_HOMAM|nr:putative Zinc knuckle-containing protein 3 [Homarus americanus]